MSTKPEEPEFITLRREDVRRAARIAVDEIAGLEYGTQRAECIEAAIIAAAVEVPECIPNFRCGLNALMRDAAPLPASAGTEERAWMIEYYNNRPLWWTGFSYSTDSLRGVRFAREEDAQAVIDGGNDCLMPMSKATEHIWTAPIPDAPKPQPSPAEVAWRFDDHARDFYPTAPKSAVRCRVPVPCCTHGATKPHCGVMGVQPIACGNLLPCDEHPKPAASNEPATDLLTNPPYKRPDEIGAYRHGFMDGQRRFDEIVSVATDTTEHDHEVASPLGAVIREELNRG